MRKPGGSGRPVLLSLRRAATGGAPRPAARRVRTRWPAFRREPLRVLCYIPGIGWIASIIVLASDRFRHDQAVRFHAFQGLYLFVAWLMNAWVLRPISAMLTYGLHLHLHSLVELVLLAMSIFMMIKAAHDQTYSLPLFGELAQRSVAER